MSIAPTLVGARILTKFYRQLRQDPEAVEAAGIAALRAKYRLE